MAEKRKQGSFMIREGLEITSTEILLVTEKTADCF